ncbi:MAG: hypothetical protein Q9191_008183 [Dirinaria sp. TL-2023a]
MHVPIAARATNTPDASSTPTDAKQPTVNAFIIVIVVLATLFLLGLVFFYLRAVRYKHSDPKYIPTSFLKSFWRSWTSKNKYGRVFRNNEDTSLGDRPDHNRSSAYSIPIQESDHSTEANEMATSADRVDRHTSVRSVITLPPYRVAPLPSEQLIAREGERAGVDTVVEYPETTQEEEARREEDMESLYQIRQARRREINDREERRRERAAAREAGDWARLEQLRLQSQARARARADSAGSSAASLAGDAVSASALIAEHQARTASRERRVSSVSYASLGLARHDGSRIRADSVESDHRPLLDSAASFGGHDRSAPSSRRGSGLFQTTNFPPLPQTERDISANSALSGESETRDTPQTSTNEERSSGSDPAVMTPSSNEHSTSPQLDRQPSSPADRPPAYDDERHHSFDSSGEEAPPYTSPATERGRGPQLPPLRHVPAIEVTGTTPANSVPPTPIDRDEGGGARGRR